MSTHNICFRWEIRKLSCGYPLLSVAMIYNNICCAAMFWFHTNLSHGYLRHVKHVSTANDWTKWTQYILFHQETPVVFHTNLFVHCIPPRITMELTMQIFPQSTRQKCSRLLQNEKKLGFLRLRLSVLLIKAATFCKYCRSRWDSS